jgi:hypothetical protein
MQYTAKVKCGDISVNIFPVVIICYIEYYSGVQPIILPNLDNVMLRGVWSK